jgi:anti-sigma regulatory factor (Ser/Thr protein kinase)
VERRGHSLDDGMTRAAGLVQSGRSQALEDVADRLMSQLEPGGGYPDDVAMLLYRQPAPFSLEFPADVSNLAGSRNALRGWLNRAGIEPDQVQDVLIATGEAVANAIEHGHRDQRVGTVSLRATAIVDRLQVTVTDTGAWKTPNQVAEFSRGRGISLMRVLMEDCSIQSSEAGTTVSMQARIT